jgi:hypothetical protein
MSSMERSMATVPSGGPGAQVVAGAEAWEWGNHVPVVNGTLEEDVPAEDRPFSLRAVTLEAVANGNTYELGFCAGQPGVEQEWLVKKFVSGQVPGELCLSCPRDYPAGERLSVKARSSAGGGTITFSVQYEANPGNVIAS